MIQTGRLPNQLARWHRVTPIPADPVPIMSVVQTNTMITGQYLVCCPKLDEREYVMGMDNAADVLYSMHCESDSYAWCEDWLGHTVMEYGDPVDGIAEMVFG